MKKKRKNTNKKSYLRESEDGGFPYQQKEEADDFSGDSADNDTGGKVKIPVNDKFYLSPPRKGDTAAWVLYLNDRQIHEQTVLIPYPYTREHAAAFYRAARGRQHSSGLPMDWTIRRSETREAIGMISFHGHYPMREGRDEIGYWLGRPFWGQGIMTSVLKRFVRAAFEDYGMKRLEMPIFTSNKASQRVAEKSGFCREAFLQKSCLKNGAWKNAYLYTLENLPLPPSS